VQSDDQLRREPGRPLEVHRQLATYRVDELHPHPSYVRHQLTVPASKLSALADRGDLGFQEPLLITREGTILDGYARWELARLQGRLTLPCIEYELTEADALRWLLDRHRRSKGLNDFIRILLALELEPLLKEKARSNQRAGGQTKGSSKLTEAERTDVRFQIATAAGVSVGNVTKVKQLVSSGHPDLLEALRRSELSIHRAWKWSRESGGRQIDVLRTYRNTRGVNTAIRELVARHKPNSLVTPDLMSLVRRLSRFKAEESTSVNVALIRVPGKTIFVTEELMRSLPPYQESIPICTADNR
jgi:hypothetical protein